MTHFPEGLKGAICLATVGTVLSLSLLRDGESASLQAADQAKKTATADSTQMEDFKVSPPSTVEEARYRARLLHETVHGLLQVVHRDFFDDDKSVNIPSRTFEDVFHVLEESHQVKLKWLAVNANAMSVDNKASDEFEKAAVQKLTAGQREHELMEEDQFRYAGMIRLSSSCLKCHVPMRRSLEDRFAALLISMPLKSKE